MKLYIANCHDRHIDPVIRVFDTLEGAINYAKAFALHGARGDASEIKEGTIPDWLYYASFSCEGDKVYVTETTLNDDK